MPNPIPTKLEAESKHEMVDTLLHISRKPQILVVDDEARIRAWLGVALPQNGFEVKLAAGGQEAVGIYREHKRVVAVDEPARAAA